MEKTLRLCVFLLTGVPAVIVAVGFGFGTDVYDGRYDDFMCVFR